jgi:primary-amine oxidase
LDDRYWLFFMGVGNGAQYLGATGFFVYIDTSGTDPSRWSLRSAPSPSVHVSSLLPNLHPLQSRKVVYNNQVFTSASAFSDAYTSGTLQRGVKPDLTNQDWSTRKRTGKARDLDERAAPRDVLFEGSRIRADKEEGYVEWMGWSFYLGFNR